MSEPKFQQKLYRQVPNVPSVKSTDDARTDKGGVRHQYRKLSLHEKEMIDELKDIGQGFMDVCEDALADGAGGREIAIAKTKIEEAVMWAVKGITT